MGNAETRKGMMTKLQEKQAKVGGHLSLNGWTRCPVKQRQYIKTVDGQRYMLRWIKHSLVFYRRGSTTEETRELRPRKLIAWIEMHRAAHASVKITSGKLTLGTNAIDV